MIAVFKWLLGDQSKTYSVKGQFTAWGAHRGDEAEHQCLSLEPGEP